MSSQAQVWTVTYYTKGQQTGQLNYNLSYVLAISPGDASNIVSTWFTPVWIFTVVGPQNVTQVS